MKSIRLNESRAEVAKVIEQAVYISIESQKPVTVYADRFGLTRITGHTEGLHDIPDFAIKLVEIDFSSASLLKLIPNHATDTTTGEAVAIEYDGPF